MKLILATIIFSIVTNTYNVQASTLAARTSNKPSEIVSDMGVGWNLGDTFDSYTYDELWFYPEIKNAIINAYNSTEKLD